MSLHCTWIVWEDAAMSINRGLATAAACLVVIAAGSSGSTAHCGGEASAGSQPRRRVRAPGCAAKCDRKRTIRTAATYKSRLPPSADGKGMRPDHRPSTPPKLPCEFRLVERARALPQQRRTLNRYESEGFGEDHRTRRFAPHDAAVGQELAMARGGHQD